MNDEPIGILFARPSFLEGVARIIDVGGTLNEYNRGLSEEQADRMALACDGRMIGVDMAKAIERAGPPGGSAGRARRQRKRRTNRSCNG